MKLVTVYDTKAQAHLQLATVRTTAEGLRHFETECKNPNSQFNKYPADFVLKEVADYDELTGIISPYESHKILATAIDFKE